jgi:hypothetical protein
MPPETSSRRVSFTSALSPLAPRRAFASDQSPHKSLQAEDVLKIMNCSR